MKNVLLYINILLNVIIIYVNTFLLRMTNNYNDKLYIINITHMHIYIYLCINMNLLMLL